MTLEEPPGLEPCSDRGATRMPSLQRFAPTIRGAHPGTFNDRCGSVTYWERRDFRCGVINGPGVAPEVGLLFPRQRTCSDC